MLWIEIENTTSRKIPKWLLSAAMADDGTIFAPAAISGNEQAAVLSASWDGVAMVMYRNHAFLPTAWLMKEYPKTQELCESIQRKMNEQAELDAGNYS